MTQGGRLRGGREGKDRQRQHTASETLRQKGEGGTGRVKIAHVSETEPEPRRRREDRRVGGQQGGLQEL